MVEIRHIANR